MPFITDKLNELLTLITSQQQCIESLEGRLNEQRNCISSKDKLLKELEIKRVVWVKRLEEVHRKKAKLKQKFRVQVNMCLTERERKTEKMSYNELKIKDLERHLECRRDMCKSLTRSLQSANEKRQVIPKLIRGCKWARQKVNLTGEQLNLDLKRLRFQCKAAIQVGLRYRKLATDIGLRIVRVRAGLRVVNRKLANAHQKIHQLMFQCLRHVSADTLKKSKTEAAKVLAKVNQREAHRDETVARINQRSHVLFEQVRALAAVFLHKRGNKTTKHARKLNK